MNTQPDIAQPSIRNLPIPPLVRVDAAGLTSVGLERPRNEDQFLVATMQRTLHVTATSVPAGASAWIPGTVEGTLLVVADGIGGIRGGDVASAVAVHAVTDYLCSVMPWFDASASPTPARQASLPGVRYGLASAVAQGDQEVRRAAANGDGSPDMGTTLTVAYLRFPHLYVAHVGDTRCYLLRGSVLSQLTRDHTLAERMRTELHAEVDNDSDWNHLLWNAVGGGDHEAARPDIRRYALEPDDVIILCSDGLTKHVSDARIAAVTCNAMSAADASAWLVEEANAGGGSDNITVVVARCVPAAMRFPPTQ